MDASEFRSELLRLGKCSTVYSKQDAVKASKFVACISNFLDDRARELVRTSPGQPLLYHYASDATSYLTQVVNTTKDGNTVILRKGRHIHELLVERAWFYTQGREGRGRGAIVLREPRSLNVGKGYWNLYAAMEDSVPLVKGMGHVGISVSHYGFDRQPLASLEPLIRARHTKFHKDAGDVVGPAGVPPELLDWVCVTGCAAHDCANSLKWALAPELELKSHLKDLHNVIEAARDASDALHACVPEFVNTRAKVSAIPVDEVGVRAWWTAIGAEPSWVEKLVEANPVWRNDVLYTNLPIVTEPSAVGRLVSCIRYVLKWKPFCESRWCTVGASCRCLVGALSVGFADIMNMVRSKGLASEYYVHHWDLLDDAIRRYACTGAVASYVPEAVLMELVEDDRIVRTIDSLERTMLDEMAFVQGLPEAFWLRLSYVYRSTLHAHELRTSIITAATASACFLTRRILTKARSVPYSL